MNSLVDLELEMERVSALAPAIYNLYSQCILQRILQSSLVCARLMPALMSCALMCLQVLNEAHPPPA